MERLEWLNIVPMSVEHREELAADAAELCRSGCVTANAFIMSLVPEGEPPVPKAEILGERFLAFREAFRKTGTPCGILLQSTIGHGWAPNSPARFGRVVREDGESPYQFCPLDPDFQRYVEESVRHLAALRPDFFMVDDDFRLLTGRGETFTFWLGGRPLILRRPLVSVEAEGEGFAVHIVCQAAPGSEKAGDGDLEALGALCTGLLARQWDAGRDLLGLGAYRALRDGGAPLQAAKNACPPLRTDVKVF